MSYETDKCMDRVKESVQEALASLNAVVVGQDRSMLDECGDEYAKRLIEWHATLLKLRNELF